VSKIKLFTLIFISSIAIIFVYLQNFLKILKCNFFFNHLCFNYYLINNIQQFNFIVLYVFMLLRFFHTFIIYIDFANIEFAQSIKKSSRLNFNIYNPNIINELFELSFLFIIFWFVLTLKFYKFLSLCIFVNILIY
jgi:hypothetical protein